MLKLNKNHVIIYSDNIIFFIKIIFKNIKKYIKVLLKIKLFDLMIL